MPDRNQYQLDAVMNRKGNKDVYTDGIDTEPIRVGTGREIINYILQDDPLLAGYKIVKRGRNK